MYVVWLYRKLDYLPSLLFALFLYQLFTLFAHKPAQNRLAPLRSPDEMVEDKVYSMFITYVFHSVDTIAKINTIFNNYFLSVCAYRARSGGLKSVEKPRLTARSKERRLAAGLTVKSKNLTLLSGLQKVH
jgi:hypothetical protein